MKRFACLLCVMAMVAGLFAGCEAKKKPLAAPALQSQNVLAGRIAGEGLTKGEKSDAENLLRDDNHCWTAQDPNRRPVVNQEDVCNAWVEIELKELRTFNTAVIEELGNEVQYFRLQAFVDGQWVTVYQSEKIQSQRLCSFDAVTTGRVRLSIDKFRSRKTPAKIKSLRLYNEPWRRAEDFTVAVYQRLDGDIPSEVLAKGTAYACNYARYYDVYNTVILFGAITWDTQGNLRYTLDNRFGATQKEKGEAFAREVAALRELVALRKNQGHEVKIICTALADGAGGNGHAGVNKMMENGWQAIADRMVQLMEAHGFDGLDVDWEYPSSKEDWARYDAFIARLDEGMQRVKPKAILSAALSAWALGMARETLARFDQIQFMAYDGQDEDGFQSSLQQAQEGLADFAQKGVDLSKINIGIAAYGRPLNSAPFWASWRGLQVANYWDSKYYNVLDSGQIYDGAFCSPALAGDKTAYALFAGAGGVMVFRLACDKTMDDPNAVVRGIENALKRYVEAW